VEPWRLPNHWLPVRDTGYVAVPRVYSEPTLAAPEDTTIAAAMRYPSRAEIKGVFRGEVECVVPPRVVPEQISQATVQKSATRVEQPECCGDTVPAGCDTLGLSDENGAAITRSVETARRSRERARPRPTRK